MSSAPETPKSQLQRKNSFSVSTQDIEELESEIASTTANAPFLFDIAWEVARKVGGIYTVMRSKAPVTVKEFGDSYALIGPYHESVTAEFEEIEPSQLTAQVLDHLLNHYGVKAHFGRWLVKGYPRVFLLELGSSAYKLDGLRHDLMPGMEAPGDSEVNDAILFGYQAAWLLESFNYFVTDRKLIAHFHEWLAGVGLIVVARKNLKIATLFTTHATLLGRYLSAGGVDLYHKMESFHPDHEAGNRGIYARHWIERSAAHGASVFSTVSDITAYEAEHLLQRKADIIVPNGLETMRFIALHEFQNLHLKYKNILNEFVRGHFAGHFDFDLDKTLYFFTAGRPELTNKGVDYYLEGLAQLNYKMKVAGVKSTVIAFIIMPGPTTNYNVDSLKGQSLIKECRRTVDDILKNIGDRLIDATARGNLPDTANLLSSEDLVQLKRSVLSIKQRKIHPPIVTHNMAHEADPVLNYIRKVQLFNKPDDRVKIIYHPEFLTRTNPLIPLDYGEFVRGCHLGVFPSYYEPWGYTPAECTMMGVPSVSSNLTGFANYMAQRVQEPENHGIFIVDRRYKGYQESVGQLSSYLWRFVQLDRRQRIELRNRTERLSPLLDWKNLGQYYAEARRMALERVFGS